MTRPHAVFGWDKAPHKGGRGEGLRVRRRSVPDGRGPGGSELPEGCDERRGGTR
jgi:hypothetical protein